eukprot:69374_1
MALFDTDEGHINKAKHSIESDPSDIELMEFIKRYKLQQIEEQLISEGITIDFLVEESESSIKQIAQELTAKSIQQKKFIYAVNKLKQTNSSKQEDTKEQYMIVQQRKEAIVQTDEWDQKLKGSKILIESNIVTQTGSWSQSAFLTNVVSSGSHQWTFKLTTFVEWNLTIGVFINDFEPTRSDLDGFYHSRTNRSYSLHANAGKLWKHDAYALEDGIYADKCKQNDIISMCLDMNAFTLSFAINDKHYRKAFDVKRTAYRAVVNLYKQGTQIQLISYKHN